MNNQYFLTLTNKFRLLLFITTIVLALILVNLFSQGLMAQEIYEMNLQHYVPSETVYYETAEHFCDMVREMSNGRLIINLFVPGAIVPAFEVSKAVTTGTLDLGLATAGMDAGVLGMTSYLVTPCNTPAGLSPIKAMAWMHIGDGLKYAEKVWQRKFDVEVVGTLANLSAELLYHSNEPIREIEDFKGKKVRTFGLWAQLLQGYGASVVSVPGGEIYTSLERGIVDVLEYATPSMDWRLGFHEITDYIGIPGIHAPTTGDLMLANKESWGKLPDDLKAIFKCALEACNAESYYRSVYESGKAIRRYKEYGTKIVSLSEDAQKRIKEDALKLYKELASEDPLFDEIYKNILDFCNTWDEYDNPKMTPQFSLFDRGE